MKTTEDAKARLANEIKLWFPRQCADPGNQFHLYYMPRTGEHSGGLVIMATPPRNLDYIRVASLRSGEDRERSYNRLWPIVAKLPILGGG